MLVLPGTHDLPVSLILHLEPLWHTVFVLSADCL